MELVQIVPALPPAFSGVGDFAVLLARDLLARHGVGTRFVVGDPGWDAPGAVAPFAAGAVAARTAGALCEQLGGRPATVLLHYVGYGYAPRGCPFWLVDALERWKSGAAGPGRRLIVLYHEVFASGPPWSSVFWLGRFQRRLAARLARLADARRITTTISRDELYRTLRRGEDLPATVAPVFSTLGAPDDPPPLDARERQVVVFGSGPVRAGVYAHGAAALTAFCRRHGIARVVDVGAPLPGGVPLPGVEVREAGALPAGEASALFSRSLAGYFTYPAPHLGKSTIFAAYGAHRMVPVTFRGNDQPGEGLRAGGHYLAGDDDKGDGAAFDGVAGAAHAWYREHRLSVHADAIRALM